MFSEFSDYFYVMEFFAGFFMHSIPYLKLSLALVKNNQTKQNNKL